MDAVKDRVSDIHIEPEAEALRIRYRIDGILHEEHLLPKNYKMRLSPELRFGGYGYC